MAKKPTPKPTAAKSRSKPSGRSASPPAGDTPLLEWISAGIGLVLLIGTIAFVGSEALKPDRSPPQVIVERLGVQQTGTGYLVQIRATNRGGSAAAQVVVEGELKAAAGPETAEATFDFIADHSSREGGLFFESDPRQGALTLRAKGYAAP